MPDNAAAHYLACWHFLQSSCHFSVYVSSIPASLPHSEPEHYIRYPLHCGTLLSHRNALSHESLKLSICTVTHTEAVITGGAQTGGKKCVILRAKKNL